MKYFKFKSKDNSTQLEKQAAYFDSVDSEQEFDFEKKQVHRGENKRVNILLPESMYNLALSIGNAAGTGYQNALKMAIMIGLNELQSKVKH
jgi:hypothetical protein